MRENFHQHQGFLLCVLARLVGRVSPLSFPAHQLLLSSLPSYRTAHALPPSGAGRALWLGVWPLQTSPSSSGARGRTTCCCDTGAAGLFPPCGFHC